MKITNLFQLLEPVDLSLVLPRLGIPGHPNVMLPLVHLLYPFSR